MGSKRRKTSIDDQGRAKRKKRPNHIKVPNTVEHQMNAAQ